MREKQKIINLYNDGRIRAVKQVISIGDEEDLNQFWEYIGEFHTLEDTATYGFFVMLYQLSTQFLETHRGTFFEIIAERSDEASYFTVWNRLFVEFALNIWKNRTIDYRYDHKRVTLRLLKSTLDEITDHRRSREDEKIHALLSSVTTVPKNTHSAVPYEFIGNDDLKELIELTEDLSEMMYEVRKKGFDSAVFIRMRSLFSMISMILNYYPQIIDVATVMTEFSVMMSQHREAVSRMEEIQIALIEGFVHNFERWLRVLFVEGGAELHFMNRSLRADVEMIRHTLEPSEYADSDDLDAIFDF